MFFIYQNLHIHFSQNSPIAKKAFVEGVPNSCELLVYILKFNIISWYTK